ncbi:glycosyltransferase [Methylomonas montana]|uniref:glycosyltransferase n=1 Tax=Methylomonas montana TaxID=3058963 RepID=UPI002659108C|nr:glycosyltransferase [Methylomonas montana]WKJ92029.1 glycosyltransferase [Methylomonas montana]
MKINYIGYFNPLIYSGGGEMVMRCVIESGMTRGHQFGISAVRPGDCNYSDSADLDLVADVFNYPGTLKSLGAWRDFSEGFIKKIVDTRPFIHFNNAYADVCNLGYLPCSGDNALEICPHKSPTHLLRNLAAKDFSAQCFSRNELVQRLFQHSKLNVFVSPLHHLICHKLLNLIEVAPSFIMKPVIDGKRFFNQNLDRDIDYLFVGIIGEAKGLNAMREQFSDKNIHLIGKLFPGTKLDFGIYHGHVPYDEIPHFMNRAKNFVFLPRWPEPQGRVVIEAALCGCNLIANDNVGAMSFPFDISCLENFRNATDEFWETIENL